MTVRFLILNSTGRYGVCTLTSFMRAIRSSGACLRRQSFSSARPAVAAAPRTASTLAPIDRGSIVLPALAYLL